MNFRQKVLISIALFFAVTALAARSVQITWQNTSEGNKIFYPTEPVAKLTWSIVDDAKRAVKFRVKVSPENAAGNDSLTQTVETTDLTTVVHLKGAGKYIALVQALDDKGKVVGNSEVKDFELQQTQTLPAPTFLTDEAITASDEGRTELKWKLVEGALSYVVSLINGEGKLVKNFNAPLDTLLLTNLYPGRYQVQVYGVDKYGRNGAISEKKALTVPAGPTLQVPKIKRVSVVE